MVAAPSSLAALVRSDSDAVGFRIPRDALLGRLLERSGPLAVTSANRHGEPPCTKASEVLSQFDGHAGFGGVLDDGDRQGVVSTVIDVSTSDWRVLREGAIPIEAIQACLD